MCDSERQNYIGYTKKLYFGFIFAVVLYYCRGGERRGKEEKQKERKEKTMTLLELINGSIEMTGVMDRTVARASPGG